MLIKIYGLPMCEACEAAVSIVEHNNLPYEYFNVQYLNFDEINEVLNQRSDPTNRTTPIIFIDNREIGNLDELREFIRNSPNLK